MATDMPQGVFEAERQSVLGRYFLHCCCEDMSVDVGDDEGIVHGERTPASPLDQPEHYLYCHV